MTKSNVKKASRNELRFIPVRTLAHIEWLRAQRNRPALMKYFRQSRPIAKNEQRQWWKHLNKENVRLFIVVAKDGRRVGYVGLNPIDWRHKYAEFGIFMIPEAQGAGYGKRAIRFLLSYGFGKLGLHKIYSDVIDYPDENRFEIYRRIGFKKEGVYREHYRKRGRWLHSIPFSMLESEFKRMSTRRGK